MMENPGGNWPEEQRVKSRSAWPMVVGVVAVVAVLLASLGVAAWKLGWLPEFSRWSKPEVIELNPLTSSNNTISNPVYEWSHDGSSFKLTLPIPEDIYDYYRKMERAPIEDYSIYVTHPYDDAKLVNPLAAELNRLAVQKGYDAEETVNFTASFVQNLKYEEDANGEYPNYPVETLYDKKGDCEDLSILTASLLQSMGYDAVLIRFTSPREGEAGHMAVGVVVTGVSGGYSYTYDGKKYYYLETTSTWPVGEVPPEILSKYKGKSDAIYKLVQAPALRFSGNLDYSGTKTVDISVTVTNWGTANADDFYVRAYFDGRESDAKSSATYDLAYGHRISGVVTKGIVKPSGGGSLQVELWLGGEVVDDWTLEFH
jgi:hypothetical protein